MAMAALFANAGYSFGIIHCNFKLRGAEANADEQFVKELAIKYNVPCYSKAFETEEISRATGDSIQMVARDLRYAFFNEIAEAHKYDFIAIVDFIIAYPDETEKEREETFQFVVNLLKKYRVRIQFHHFFPISGSNLSKRFPSYLTEKEKKKFLKLNVDGGSTVSWLIGEKVTKDFFTWLEKYSPEHFSQYR
jgi:hypothetical protein